MNHKRLQNRSSSNQELQSNTIQRRHRILIHTIDGILLSDHICIIRSEMRSQTRLHRKNSTILFIHAYCTRRDNGRESKRDNQHDRQHNQGRRDMRPMRAERGRHSRETTAQVILLYTSPRNRLTQCIRRHDLTPYN